MISREFGVGHAGAGFHLVKPMLIGRVFHATPLKAWLAIQRRGAILPNIENKLATGFGSSRNSFCRKRGCVSLFDYRSATEEQIEDALWKCSPLQIARYESPAVLLVLAPELHERLVPWTDWETQKAHTDMLVPYVECGHPGLIQLREIEQSIIVRVTTAPDPNSLAERLCRARMRLEARPTRD